jgi:hypothetical protein
MKIEKNAQSEAVIVLTRKELELLKLALERATFVDTPPDRQRDILVFAEEMLKGLSPLVRP